MLPFVRSTTASGGVQRAPPLATSTDTAIENGRARATERGDSGRMKGIDSRTMAGRAKANTQSARSEAGRPQASKRPTAEVDGFSDDYLSVVAHDLRGSLNSIIGWAELIKRKALNEAGNVRAGETIIRQARQQLELINEVVDTWRLLSGNLQLKLAPVDAKELVNTAAYAAKESSAKAFDFDFQLEALPAPLLADGARLRQAMIGLFNSAIHFAPEKGTVEVRLRPVDTRMAELTVHDAGVGVDPEALPYLFSRQRPKDPGKQSARAKYGRGLGLIRDIIDLHGGTIKAETDGVSGVTFRVTLPFRPHRARCAWTKCAK